MKALPKVNSNNVNKSFNDNLTKIAKLKNPERTPVRQKPYTIEVVSKKSPENNVPSQTLDSNRNEVEIGDYRPQLLPKGTAEGRNKTVRNNVSNYHYTSFAKNNSPSKLKNIRRDKSANLTPVKFKDNTKLSYNNIASNTNIRRALDDSGQLSQSSLPLINKGAILTRSMMKILLINS